MHEQISMNGLARDDVFRLGGPPSWASTAERIAAALELLVEKLGGGPAVEKEAPSPPEPSINGDRVFHPSVAAKLMLLNHQTVRKHCRQGRYGFQDGSGRWWIRQSEIDHYLKGRKRIHGK